MVEGGSGSAAPSTSARLVECTATIEGPVGKQAYVDALIRLLLVAGTPGVSAADVTAVDYTQKVSSAITVSGSLRDYTCGSMQCGTNAWALQASVAGALGILTTESVGELWYTAARRRLMTAPGAIPRISTTLLTVDCGAGLSTAGCV